MLDIEVKGLEELIKRHQEARKSIRRIAVQYIGNLGQYARFLCREELEDVRYTGALANSFVVDVNMSEMSARVYPTASHRMYVRMGTRPHWAPPEPIKRWAAKKLGTDDYFPILRSIATHGTSVYQLRKRGEKANPWPKRVIARDDFGRALKKTAKEIGQHIAVEIAG